MKGEGSDKQQVLESWADSAQWGVHKLCHLPNPVYSMPAFVNHTLIKQRWPTLMLSKLALLVTSYSRSRAVKKALTFQWRHIQLKMWTVITAFDSYLHSHSIIWISIFILQLQFIHLSFHTKIDFCYKLCNANTYITYHTFSQYLYLSLIHI